MLWEYTIWSIGGKLIINIQMNITSPVFLILTCFLALPESLKVFTFMIVIGIILLGLYEQRHQGQCHHSTTEAFASELLKRVMCSIIEGIKGGWYHPRNDYQARNTISNIHTEKKNRNEHSKQHAQQQWNWN